MEKAQYFMEFYNDCLNPSDPDLKCNLLDALTVMVDIIVEGNGSEDLCTITDTSPRDCICDQLERNLIEARDNLIDSLKSSLLVDEVDDEQKLKTAIYNLIVMPNSKITYTNVCLYRDYIKLLI